MTAYTDLTTAPLWVQIPIYVLTFWIVALAAGVGWDMWRHRDHH